MCVCVSPCVLFCSHVPLCWSRLSTFPQTVMSLLSLSCLSQFVALSLSPPCYLILLSSESISFSWVFFPLSSYMLCCELVCVLVFPVLTVLRYMFNVFSFASFVSLCLICLSWVPYVFPVPSSFLVYLNPLFPSVHCYHLLQSLMAVCLPVYLVILVCVISGPAIKLISEWILTSVSLRLGPIPACITWLFMIFSVYSTTQLLE